MPPKQPRKSTRRHTKPARRRAKLEVSAGGILYARRRGVVKVVLLGKFDPYETWRLPKGHLEQGEQITEAAAREVQEESGVRGSIGPKVGMVQYYFVHPVTREYIHKYVHYFLFKKREGSVLQHDKEHDIARWFPIDQAIKRATFKGDKVMLTRARKLIRERQAQGVRARATAPRQQTSKQ